MTTSCAGGGGSGGSAGGAGGGGGGAAGGSTGSSGCGVDPAADSVGFCKGSATGMMKGAGWVALGQDDKISDPTCGGTEITKAAACTTVTTWNADDKLCLSGSIPALPATPVQTDYDNNWGVQIGINSSEPTGTNLDASAYAGVTFNITGSPMAGNRAMIHVSGDPDATTFCANFVSGTKVALTSFNTKCWDNSGDYLNVKRTDDLKKIDKMGVQVSSTSAAITVDKLCLTSIAFTK